MKCLRIIDTSRVLGSRSLSIAMAAAERVLVVSLFTSKRAWGAAGVMLLSVGGIWEIVIAGVLNGIPGRNCGCVGRFQMSLQSHVLLLSVMFVLSWIVRRRVMAR